MDTKDIKVKKWGNSFGIIIPKDIVEKQEIKEGITLRVNIQVKNKTKAKDVFGILKTKMKKNTDDLLKEVDSRFE
ncbi:MAG: AbrB/MazE/SpoVT family DNA-binding domain-containing protein [Candidatus Pacearchaeota archaeon]|jgi:antitoxin component of MazEF toxin-antitoxin module